MVLWYHGSYIMSSSIFSKLYMESLNRVFAEFCFENIYGFPGKIVVENLTKIFWKSPLTLQKSILINGFKKILVILIKDHPFSTYAKCYEKLTFLPPDAQKKVCLCQGVRSVSFSESFAHVINE